MLYTITPYHADRSGTGPGIIAHHIPVFSFGGFEETFQSCFPCFLLSSLALHDLTLAGAQVAFYIKILKKVSNIMENLMFMLPGVEGVLRNCKN